MGTRSYIGLQIEEDEYLTIFCHYNGYPDDNGAILAEHYDKQEKVESLIQLGDLYFLRSKLEPNPDLPHNHSTPQPNVTIAYNRDEGWSDCEAVHKTLDELNQSTCQHIQNVSVEDVGSFENLEDAYAAGYRLCRHCSPIAKLYRKESDVLQGYCQSHAASVFFKDRFIGISTPISDWRIIPSGKGNEVVLYHKNTLGDKKTGPVPGYHLQRVSQNTISGYLEYISDHDLYRNMHPLYPVQSKKNSPPPMKGTKRYRKEQKRAAKKARRQSIAHVLTLIENLDTQARVARSM